MVGWGGVGCHGGAYCVVMRVFGRVVLVVALLPWVAVSAGGRIWLIRRWYQRHRRSLTSAAGELASAGGLYSSLVPARVAETRSGPGLETVDGLFQGDGPVAGGRHWM